MLVPNLLGLDRHRVDSPESTWCRPELNTMFSTMHALILRLALVGIRAEDPSPDHLDSTQLASFPSVPLSILTTFHHHHPPIYALLIASLPRTWNQNPNQSTPVESNHRPQSPSQSWMAAPSPSLPTSIGTWPIPRLKSDQTHHMQNPIPVTPKPTTPKCPIPIPPNRCTWTLAHPTSLTPEPQAL